MVDFNFTSGYQPPGVYTEDVGGPQLAVRTSVPTAVAIFGTSVAYRSYREAVRINSDAANDSGDIVPTNSATLKKSGIKAITTPPVLIVVNTDPDVKNNVDITAPGATLTGLITATGVVDEYTPALNALIYLNDQTRETENGLYRFKGAAQNLEAVVDSFKVVNPDSGVPYVNGLDYTIVKVSSGNAELTTTRDDLYAIKRIDRGSGVGITEGKLVQVSYRYTSPDYFAVRSLYDYDDVRDIYGEPFDANGNIQSEITLAAKFAFMNGASTVLTCAVDTETYPSTPEAYLEALKLFRDEEQIAIVVPGTGQPWVYSMVRTHVEDQSKYRYERRAILGFDGSEVPVDTNTRQDTAESISNRRVAIISPSRFTYFAPELNDKITLGGQYMAAAVAGKSVSMIAAMPLTRKVITGFNGPAETPMQREQEKNLETQNGLMVVEKTRRNQVQVRHGVTSDPTDLLTREWSIIGQQDVMVYRIRDYLDADGLIGMPIYDTTLIQVKASAEAALQSLMRDEIIVGYKNLKVRQLATLPDVIEVRYEWKPAYPLNYIVVRYSVEVMTGDVTPNDANI